MGDKGADPELTYSVKGFHGVRSRSSALAQTCWTSFSSMWAQAIVSTHTCACPLRLSHTLCVRGLHDFANSRPNMTTHTSSNKVASIDPVSESQLSSRNVHPPVFNSWHWAACTSTTPRRRLCRSFQNCPQTLLSSGERNPLSRRMLQ